MMSVEIYNEDCLIGMDQIKPASVDMILSDLPYGTTKCKWDICISLDKLWHQYNRIIKKNGAILLFSAQPFTTDLINSNRKMFRYEIIWEKTMKSGFLNAKKMPLRAHENILVFYKKLPTYNPVFTKKEGFCKQGRLRQNSKSSPQQYNEFARSDYVYTETGFRYPIDIIKCSNWNGALFGNTQKATVHPTQKPIALLEYLIRTYTNQGDLVLDSCAGSGSTGKACINTGRNFVGFEKDADIFATAESWLNSDLQGIKASEGDIDECGKM